MKHQLPKMTANLAKSIQREKHSMNTLENTHKTNHIEQKKVQTQYWKNIKTAHNKEMRICLNNFLNNDNKENIIIKRAGVIKTDIKGNNKENDDGIDERLSGLTLVTWGLK